MRVKRRVRPTVGATGARFPRQTAQDEPGTVGSPDPDATGAEFPRRHTDSAVGVTGARFPRSPITEPPSTEADDPPASAPTASDPAPPPLEDDRPTAGSPSPVPAEATIAGSAPAVPPVRPYVLTHGRTRSAIDLPLEALISAVATDAGSADSTLVQLCRTPRSVAETAAVAGIPLGVARVLIGDLVTAGALVVHETAGPAGPDLALLRRVLAGLQGL